MTKKVIFFMALALFMQIGTSLVNPELLNSTTIAAPTIQKKQTTYYEPVDAIDVVKYPSRYLNRCIKIDAIFDKFSVVGLDYKPAFRSSEDYILFLIRKTEVKGHIIPLAEMKIFIKRDEAEKYVDLESGDSIEFTGKVFSTALGEPWIEVDSLKVKNKVSKTKELNEKLKSDVINKVPVPNKK